MIHCHFCGVELQDNANYCSLCGEPVLKDPNIKPDHLNMHVRRVKEHTKYKHLNYWQRRKIILELSALILSAEVLIITIIDLLMNHALTWSVIVIGASLLIFINISLVLFYYGKRTRIFVLSYIATVAFILLTHNQTGYNTALLQWGIPALFLVVYLVTFTLIALIRKIKQKGLNLIAFSMIAGGLLCLCIEAIIKMYIIGRITLNWSVIVIVATLFTAALLFYLHGRLKKLNDLKRFFHI